MIAGDFCGLLIGDAKEQKSEKHVGFEGWGKLGRDQGEVMSGYNRWICCSVDGFLQL